MSHVTGTNQTCDNFMSSAAVSPAETWVTKVTAWVWSSVAWVCWKPGLVHNPATGQKIPDSLLCFLGFLGRSKWNIWGFSFSVLKESAFRVVLNISGTENNPFYWRQAIVAFDFNYNMKKSLGISPTFSFLILLCFFSSDQQ